MACCGGQGSGDYRGSGEPVQWCWDQTSLLLSHGVSDESTGEMHNNTSVPVLRTFSLDSHHIPTVGGVSHIVHPCRLSFVSSHHLNHGLILWPNLDRNASNVNPSKLFSGYLKWLTPMFRRSDPILSPIIPRESKHRQATGSCPQPANQMVGPKTPPAPIPDLSNMAPWEPHANVLVKELSWTSELPGGEGFEARWV